MSKCKKCSDPDYKDWVGDAPKCAFMGDRFSPENWNCGTANAIRDICYEGQQPIPQGVDYQYYDDNKYATIKIYEVEGINADALWIGWYKTRGATQAIWLLDQYDEPRPPTEAECLAIIAYYQKERP